MLKQKLFTAYLVFGITVSIFFGMAAKAGVQLPKMPKGSSSYRSSGRSYGGSWGGGK